MPGEALIYYPPLFGAQRAGRTKEVNKANGLKRLKKILDKEGIIKTLRDQRYFEKPCVKARKKSARARIRNRSRRRSAEM